MATICCVCCLMSLPDAPLTFRRYLGCFGDRFGPSPRLSRSTVEAGISVRSKGFWRMEYRGSLKLVPVPLSGSWILRFFPESGAEGSALVVPGGSLREGQFALFCGSETAPSPRKNHFSGATDPPAPSPSPKPTLWHYCVYEYVIFL